MKIFYRDKAFHAGKNIKKNDFLPSEKFLCYVPAIGYASVPVFGLMCCEQLQYGQFTNPV